MDNLFVCKVKTCLASQNAGLANIEISDKNIKAFSRVAKKYHVDFALKKDTTAEQPRYLVFFKSRDADAITAAFQEFASRKMSREEKPSIRERLTQAKEQAAEKVEHRTIDREKVKVKDIVNSDSGCLYAVVCLWQHDVLDNRRLLCCKNSSRTCTGTSRKSIR